MSTPQPRLTDSPRARTIELVGLIGEAAVARWCADLLAKRVAYADSRRPPITWLGGGHAVRLLKRRGFDVRGQDYWPRVWGARGLLYAWSDGAADAVIASLVDEAWRVREMAAKVVRGRQLADADVALSTLLDDAVPRVRAAAVRALGRVGEIEQGELVAQSARDSEAIVRIAARRALAEMEKRLDHEFRG